MEIVLNLACTNERNDYKKMQKTLAEVLKDIKIDKQLKNCDLLKMQVDKQNRGMHLILKLDDFMPMELVARFREQLVFTYKLKSCKVEVLYNGVIFDSDFLEKYKENIIFELAQASPIFGYAMIGSEWLLEEDKLRVMLRHGCAALLLEKKCDVLIERQLKNEIGAKVKVEFGEEIEEMNFDIAPIEYVKEIVKETTDEIVKVPDGVITGKEIKGSRQSIEDISPESGKVIIAGDITSVSTRNVGAKLLVMFNITDYLGSISCKFFTTSDKFEQFKDEMKPGKSIMVQGEAQYDKYDKDTIIMARNISKAKKELKMDTAPKKRVELHVHTQMSAMDAVSSAESLVRRAIDWEMKAIAITDHGVVQSFPNAASAKGKNDIKIIYGVECYLVLDSVSAVLRVNECTLDDEFIVFDIETTGLNDKADAITEIGAVKVLNGKVVDSFSTFVNPKRPIPQKIIDLTGITDRMVADAPQEEQAVKAFLEFCGNAPVVAHNASFDTGFISASAKRTGLIFQNPIVDTLEIARALLPELKRHKLNLIAEHLGIENANHHRAVNDAEVTTKIWLNFVDRLKSQGVKKLADVNASLAGAVNIARAKTYHAIIFAKNEKGLKNLYRIISDSHLKYYHKRPRVPKSLYMQYSDGLMIGSACEAGELYTAILKGKTEEEIEKIAKFYDYYEIQPLGNNRFLIRDGTVENEERLKQINREIIKLGEKHKKLVVATGDVHFLDARDEIFRRILMAGQGFSDADNQAPLYLRTTDEMLAEFSYLGKEKAYEVVVINTNAIADMIEDIRPVKQGTYPPTIENSAEDLKRLTYDRAKKLYGEELPEIVKNRIEKELTPIIKYGFDVMYMIAQKLVKKSNDDGYIVGSRGSVGSSLVAFLSGITTINSLKAHYLCPNCKNSEFPDTEPGLSGCDLEDKLCPKCNTQYIKDGHDIPFETFLGFEGDKAPDIDLNFSGDYQSKAHKYTEELFGEGFVFRAGTISTIAEKTAYGYVRKYFEEKGKVLHSAEIERLKIGCTGIKKTTGQHPGGIIVCPKDMDIHEFTPVQRPADKVESDIITTHFDYHSIHDNLLKLDILGHDDPTVIKMLEDLTNTNSSDIALDDEATMSLFTSTKALNVEPQQIDSLVGTLAIPEFGTKFVRGMLLDTKPKRFSELIRISGLSHGTDVWLGNAKDLIKDGKCNLLGCICTRDDIMAYLISMELDPKMSFDIMESVRKGKGLKPNWIEAMQEKKVPQWYIDSCIKIKYMFPKAHAAAYVSNAFRIAWYKVNYPLEFYMTYFTVRADNFNSEIMAKGPDVVNRYIEETIEKGKETTAKEDDTLTILEVCREMYARKIEFEKIDLYASHPSKFLEKNGKILPPLNSIPGLGGTAAENVAIAREEGEFFSVDDFKARTKVSKTVIDLLQQNGYLEGLPQSSQVTMFEV